MHPTRRNIVEATRAKMGEEPAAAAQLLGARLADAIDLYAQAKPARWNVMGPQFIALHELFNELADAVEEGIGELVERAVALGRIADATRQSSVGRTSLAAYPVDLTAGAEHVGRLTDALATYARNVRAAIDPAAEAGDAGTSDVFTELSREADKQPCLLDQGQGY
jgi:starvation-inducible DNA-binding protein